MKRKPAGAAILLRHFSLICLVLLAAACTAPSVSQPDPKSLITSTPSAAEPVLQTTRVMVEGSMLISPNTYKEIIEQADIIIIGKVTDTGWTFNSARQDEINWEPHPKVYDHTRIYEVHVDRYLKGAGPESFYVFKSEGMAFGRSPEELQEVIEKGELEFKQAPLSPDRLYLMFLTHFDAKTIFPEVPEGVYYNKTYPGIFDLSDPGRLRIVDEGAYNYDFALPLEQVEAYIRDPKSIPPTPTIVPEAIEMSPYPYP